MGRGSTYRNSDSLSLGIRLLGRLPITHHASSRVTVVRVGSAVRVRRSVGRDATTRRRVPCVVGGVGA